MKTKKLFGQAEILHNLPYEAISATLDKATAGVVVENGRKILKAGAILAGDEASIFADRTKKVKQSTTAADGILLYDADVTDGDASVAVVYRGTLREDKVNGGTVPEAIKGKLPHVQFVKGV